MSEQPLSFEQALAELEQIISRLEAGDLTLEETLSQFERGQELATLCEKALQEAELRLEKLRPLPGGGYEAVPATPDTE